MPLYEREPREPQAAWIVQTLVYGALAVVVLVILWRVLVANGIV